MKKLLLFFAVSALLFAACKKDFESSNPENKKLLANYKVIDTVNGKQMLRKTDVSEVRNFKRVSVKGLFTSTKLKLIDSLSLVRKTTYSISAKSIIPIPLPFIPRPFIPRPIIPRPFLPLNICVSSYNQANAYGLTAQLKPIALILESGRVLRLGVDFLDLDFQIQPEFTYSNPYRAQLGQTYTLGSGIQTYGQNCWANGCSTDGAPNVQLCNVYLKLRHYIINSYFNVYYINGGTAIENVADVVI